MLILKPEEHLSTLSKLEKLFLSRRMCGFCEQLLNRNSCGSIYCDNECTDSDIINRRKRCLKTYKPRGLKRELSKEKEETK